MRLHLSDTPHGRCKITPLFLVVRRAVALVFTSNMNDFSALKQSAVAQFRFIALILSTLLFISLGIANEVSPQTGTAVTAPRRILFLGNSLTLHGPSVAIEWSGNWGMAATALDKDYVHLVVQSLSKTAGTAPEIMIRNVVELERQFATYDVETKLKEPIEFGADLVILAIGENVPALNSDEAKAGFKTSVTKLLAGLKAKSHPTIVVRSCFWANPAKDQILKQVCQEAGGIFVDISQLGKDESNFARSERPFKSKSVANHPGDKGMQAIANAISEAIANKAGTK